MNNTITVEVADLLQKQYISQSIAIIIIAIGVVGTIWLLLKPKKALASLQFLVSGIFGFHSYMDAVHKTDDLRIKRILSNLSGAGFQAVNNTIMSILAKGISQNATLTFYSQSEQQNLQFELLNQSNHWTFKTLKLKLINF